MAPPGDFYLKITNAVSLHCLLVVSCQRMGMPDYFSRKTLSTHGGRSVQCLGTKTDKGTPHLQAEEFEKYTQVKSHNC